jgi:hypothetical protein
MPKVAKLNRQGELWVDDFLWCDSDVHAPLRAEYMPVNAAPV